MPRSLNTYNPVLLKLELLSLGLRIDEQHEDELWRRAKKPHRIRAGVGGSGLDLILEKDVWINVPIHETFALNSPFQLTMRDDEFVIVKNGEVVQATEIFPEPAFYQQTTSRGIPMSRVGAIQGDFLAVSADSDCMFFGGHGGQRGTHCRYCVMGLNTGRTEENVKLPEDVVEVYAAAKAEKACRHISLNSGALPNPGGSHENLAIYIRALKAQFDVHIRTGSVAPEREEYIDLLLDAGVDSLGLHYEIFDPKLYAEICPGKNEMIDHGVPHQQYDRMLRYAVDRVGKNQDDRVVHSNLIAGLEPRESTVQGMEHLASMGVAPRLIVFRPLLNSSLRNHPTPTPVDLVYIYRHLKTIVEQKYGLDVGCPGCGRIEVATKLYMGLVPHMPEITDADMERAGYKAADIEASLA